MIVHLTNGSLSIHRFSLFIPLYIHISSTRIKTLIIPTKVMVNFLEDDTFFFSPLRYLSLGFPRLFFTMRQFHDWNKEAIIEREGSDGNGLNKQACRFHSTSRSLVNPTILLPGFITYIKQTLAQDFTKKIDRVSGIRSLSVFASSTLLHHVGSNCAPVFPKVSPGGRGGGRGGREFVLLASFDDTSVYT